MIPSLQRVQSQLDQVILQIDDVLDALSKEETSHRWLVAKMHMTTALLLEIKAELVAARTILANGGE